MALATHTDLEVRLGVELEKSEQDRADELLIAASELVMAEAGSVEEDKAPPVAKAICLDVAARQWINPNSVQSESMGSTSVSFSPVLGLTLTTDEIKLLRRGFRGKSSYSMQFR